MFLLDLGFRQRRSDGPAEMKMVTKERPKKPLWVFWPKTNKTTRVTRQRAGGSLSYTYVSEKIAGI